MSTPGMQILIRHTPGGPIVAETFSARGTVERRVDNTGRLTLQAPATAAWLEHVAPRCIIETVDVYGVRDGWVVLSDERTVGEDGTVRLSAVPLLDLLTAWQVTLADKVDVEQRTPLQLWDELIQPALDRVGADWLVAGLLDDTLARDYQLDAPSIRQLIDQCVQATGLDVWLSFVGDGVWRLNIATRIGSPIVSRISGWRNMSRLRSPRNVHTAATVILPRGDAPVADAPRATLADMVARVVAVIDGEWVEIRDPTARGTVIAVDGQWVGHYVTLRTGAVRQILGSVAAPERLRLSSTSTIGVGDDLAFATTADGTGAVVRVVHPAASAAPPAGLGMIERVLRVDGARGERNLIPNAVHERWTPVPTVEPASDGTFTLSADHGTAVGSGWGIAVATIETSPIPAGRLVVLQCAWISGATLSVSAHFGVGNPVTRVAYAEHLIGDTGLYRGTATFLGLTVTPTTRLAAILTMLENQFNEIIAGAASYIPSGTELVIAPVPAGIASGMSTTPAASLAGLDTRGWLYVGTLLTTGAPQTITEDADYSSLAPVTGDGIFAPRLHRAWRQTTASSGDSYTPTLAAAQDWSATLVAVRTYTPASDHEPGTHVGQIATLPGGNVVGCEGLRAGLVIPIGSRVRMPSTPDVVRTTTTQETVAGGGTVTLQLSGPPTGQSVGNRVRIDIVGDPPDLWTPATTTMVHHRRGRGMSMSGTIDGAQTTRQPLIAGLPPGAVVEYGDRVHIAGTDYIALATDRVGVDGRVRVSLNYTVGTVNTPPSFTDGASVTITPPTWPAEPGPPNQMVLPAHWADDIRVPVRVVAGRGPLHIAAGITYWGPAVTTGSGTVGVPRIQLVRPPSTVLLSFADESRSVPAWSALHVRLQPPSSFTPTATEMFELHVRGTTTTATIMPNSSIALMTVVRWAMAWQGAAADVPPVDGSWANHLLYAAQQQLRLRARVAPDVETDIVDIGTWTPNILSAARSTSTASACVASARSARHWRRRAC